MITSDNPDERKQDFEIERTRQKLPKQGRCRSTYVDDSDLGNWLEDLVHLLNFFIPVNHLNNWHLNILGNYLRFEFRHVRDVLVDLLPGNSLDDLDDFRNLP